MNIKSNWVIGIPKNKKLIEFRSFKIYLYGKKDTDIYVSTTLADHRFHYHLFFEGDFTIIFFLWLNQKFISFHNKVY